jgi:hypothetical protein
MSVTLEREKAERAAAKERLEKAVEAKRAAAESGEPERSITAADIDRPTPVRKGPFGTDAGPHRFDEAKATAALKDAPTYDDACYAYNAAAGANLAPGDFQARCRNKGLARPGGRAPIVVATPPPAATPPAVPGPAGKAPRTPWVKSAMRAATKAESNWIDAVARYNAATGQSRTWQRFQICCLTEDIRPNYPRANRTARDDRPKSAPTPAPTPEPIPGPVPQVSPDCPAIAPDRPAIADPPLGPVRAPVALDRDWEMFLAGLHLVARFGLGPATLRRIADVLEATKGVPA